MPRNVVIVPLAELTTVRIVCAEPGCQRAVELPLADLAKDEPPSCPGCQKPFGRSGLATLANAMIAVRRMRNILSVEFALPGEPDDSAAE